MTLTYIQELKYLLNCKSHHSNASKKIFSVTEIILNYNSLNIDYVNKF